MYILYTPKYILVQEYNNNIVTQSTYHIIFQFCVIKVTY